MPGNQRRRPEKNQKNLRPNKWGGVKEASGAGGDINWGEGGIIPGSRESLSFPGSWKKEPGRRRGGFPYELEIMARPGAS